MKTKRGWVLLIILIFFQITSALSWYLLNTTHMMFKLGNDLRMSRQEVANIENIGERIVRSPLSEPCFIPLISAKTLQQKPKAWWLVHGCGGIFNGIRYYYVIEFLANDDCTIIESMTANAAFYRLTVLSEQPQLIVLQSVFAKPNTLAPKCSDPAHIRTIKAGLQMKRTKFL